MPLLLFDILLLLSCINISFSNYIISNLKFLEGIFFPLNWLTKEEKKGNEEKESKHGNSKEFARTSQIPALLHKLHPKTKQDWNSQSKAINKAQQIFSLSWTIAIDS